MLTKKDIINELKSHMLNLYKDKESELKRLKNMPGDGVFKHIEMRSKVDEMSGVAECLNFVYDFERCWWEDLK